MRYFEDREDQLDIMIGVFITVFMGSIAVAAVIWLVLSIVVGTYHICNAVVGWVG